MAENYQQCHFCQQSTSVCIYEVTCTPNLLQRNATRRCLINNSSFPVPAENFPALFRLCLVLICLCHTPVCILSFLQFCAWWLCWFQRSCSLSIYKYPKISWHTHERVANKLNEVHNAGYHHWHMGIFWLNHRELICYFYFMNPCSAGLTPADLWGPRANDFYPTTKANYITSSGKVPTGLLRKGEFSSKKAES